MRYHFRPRGFLGPLLCGCVLLAVPAIAQTDPGPSLSPEIASQKARMIESFLISGRVRKAIEENPGEVAQLIDTARAKLEAGEAALAQSQIAEAIHLFDESLRALSQAVATHGAKKEASAAHLETQRRQIASYVEAFTRNVEVSAAERDQIELVRARLASVPETPGSEWRQKLSELYDDTIELASRMTRGRTLVVEKSFETPEAEFEYERMRNDSYMLLVQIALAEHGELQPGLEKFAERMHEESARLRAEAEAAAQKGETVDGVRLLERATARLAVVLRSAGVLTMGE